MFDLSIIQPLGLFLLFYYFIYKIGILTAAFELLKDSINNKKIFSRKDRRIILSSLSVIFVPIIMIVTLIYLFFNNNRFQKDKEIRENAKGLYYVSDIEVYDGWLSLQNENKCVLNFKNTNCSWKVENSIISITGFVNGEKINLEAKLGDKGIIINDVFIECLNKYN